MESISRDSIEPMSSPDLLYRSFPDFEAWSPLTAEDRDLWNRFAASLEERRKEASPEALRQAVDVAVRAAALDTGAIEGLYDVDRGFTMTVAVQGLAWEQMIEERGAGVRELFEAQLKAYELVLDAATRRQPLTEAWIRSLHEILCAPQKSYRALTSQGWQEQELPKGEYKRQPNHVRLKDGSFHAYAPVDQVSSEMRRLVEQTRSPDFESAHPILQASYVHYALVVIHPFADGNGRVARALASIFFYRACSIPFLVFANQRLAYFDALQATDLGDSGPLLTFFQDRGIDTMQLVTEGLMTAVSPDLKELAARVKRKASKIDSLEQLSAIASRLDREISSAFRQAVERAGLSPETLHLETGVTAHDNPNRFSFRITAQDSQDSLDVRLEDVYPELAETFKLRLDGWVRRQLGRLLLGETGL
jgi:Fic family protein